MKIGQQMWVSGTQYATLDVEKYMDKIQKNTDDNYFEEEKTPITLEMVEACWTEDYTSESPLARIVHTEFRWAEDKENDPGIKTTIGDILFDVLQELLDWEGQFGVADIDESGVMHRYIDDDTDGEE